MPHIIPNRFTDIPAELLYYRTAQGTFIPYNTTIPQHYNSQTPLPQMIYPHTTGTAHPKGHDRIGASHHLKSSLNNASHPFHPLPPPKTLPPDPILHPPHSMPQQLNPVGTHIRHFQRAGIILMQSWIPRSITINWRFVTYENYFISI
jgi:hypothetical protein